MWGVVAWNSARVSVKTMDDMLDYFFCRMVLALFCCSILFLLLLTRTHLIAVALDAYSITSHTSIM